LRPIHISNLKILAEVKKKDLKGVVDYDFSF